MTFFIFLIILGMLVFVHELGHFLFAKMAGVKVEEFGFGYPPRALKIGYKWGTLFSLNWIPFGGFVKIVGENYEEETSPAKDGASFTQVSKKWQAIILAAGVTFNIIFAWLLFSVGFMIGVPTSASSADDFGAAIKNPVLMVIDVVSNSPAQKAGLKSGDKIEKISLPNGNALQDLQPESVSNFINNSSDGVLIEVDRGNKILDFKITPQAGIVPDKKIIGIDMDMVGTLYLPPQRALYEGAIVTYRITYLTGAGLVNLIKEAAVGKANISEVSGPVGIIGLVGDASRLGFAYLLTFTALISINLAIINLIPFPALDGGRILFVAIEGIFKRKINPKIAQALNIAGFAMLIILMAIVTYRDILKLL